MLSEPVSQSAQVKMVSGIKSSRGVKPIQCWDFTTIHRRQDNPNPTDITTDINTIDGRISLRIFRRTLSVEWNFLNADWKGFEVLNHLCVSWAILQQNYQLPWKGNWDWTLGGNLPCYPCWVLAFSREKKCERTRSVRVRHIPRVISLLLML